MNRYLVCNENGEVRLFVTTGQPYRSRGEWICGVDKGIPFPRRCLAHSLEDLDWDDNPVDLFNYD